MVAKRPRIVIVGAGMAGLTAAHQLRLASLSPNSCFDLLVLEASHRIGGRIHTSKFEGDQVELGATWIHGIEGSPIYDIAQKIGALRGDAPWERQDGFPGTPIIKAEGGLTVDTAIVSPVVDTYKKLISDARDKSPAKTKYKHRSVGAFLRDSLNSFLSSQTSVSENGRLILSSKGNESKTVENQLCNRAGSLGWNLKSLQDGVFSMHEHMERVLTGCDSLFDLDLECEREYEDYPGEHITIGRGYISVLNELASSLPAGTIQFGKKVQRFAWNCSQGFYNSPVLVECEDGSVCEADHVIITVSLGVLKAGTESDHGELVPCCGDDGRCVNFLVSRVPNGSHISCGLFDPPLPPWKLQAISRLGFGVVDKLFLHIDRQVGEQLRSHLQFIYKKQNTRSGSIPWWMRKTYSLCPISKDSSVLLAWFAGEEAKEMENLTDKEIIEGVVNTLAQFGYPQQDPLQRLSEEDTSDSEESCSEDGVMGRLSMDSGCNKERLGKMFCGVLHSSWAKNPLFHGSYSYVATGSSGLDFETLAEPLPIECNEGKKETAPLQLLFAGEATDRHFYSTTHGAYNSGLREANRLLHHYGWCVVQPLQMAT